MPAQPFIGEIQVFAGDYAPQGWALCDGSLLDISQNSALFSLVGTTYGGDGQTTFALPDLRGRHPVGQGQAPGLSNYVIGEVSGVETVTLNTLQLQVHSHPANVATRTSTATPINQYWGPARGHPYGTPSGPTKTANTCLMAPAAVGAAGGSLAHENRPPSLPINFIISIFGIYPSQ
jgi:microcystin-dependent protein